MKPFFDHKFEDVFVDEEENFKKYYQEDIEKGPTRFDKFLKGLRKVFGIAMPGITAVAIPTMLVACQPDKPTPPKPDDKHKHKLTYVAATKESCTQDGMQEHWTCDDCGKTFSDSNGQNEVDEDDLKIQAHHTLTHQTKKDATCTQDGNIDYYHCTACGENFLDENGTNKVDNIVIAAGHKPLNGWQHDENNHWQACENCDEHLNESKHNFENYVCTECGAEDVNAPLSKEEIVDFVIPNIQNTLISVLGDQSITQIKNILAVDFVEKENSHLLHLLVDYHTSWAGIESDFICLLEVPMATEMTKETIRSAQYVPAKNTSATKVINFNKNSDDDRGVEILKKIDPDGDHDHYDFVSVIKGTGAILPGLGITTGYDIYTISKKGITSISVDAQSSGITDPIQSSILNGIEEQNFHVYCDKSKFIEFGDDVIYNFEGLLYKSKETTEENNVEMIKTNKAPATLFVFKKVKCTEKKVYELQ